MKTLFSSLLFLFGLVQICAQNTFQIRGTVQDSHDKTLLSNAKISVGKFQATSDEEGKFTLKKIPAGTYTLTAAHPECDLFTEEITVNSDLQITVSMEHHAHEIEGVTMHGVHKNQGNLVIKMLESDEISRNSSENLGNLLSKISGVGALKTGNNVVKPVIHGLYGSRISILNNGVKMAEQEWGAEHAPNIDINNFQHIDVIKGASALKYGSDAIGGVIMLQPEIFKKVDTLKGHAQISGISNGRGISADLKLVKTWKNAWFVGANGGYRKLGDLQTPTDNLWNTGTVFNSFNFTVGNREFDQGFSADYSVTNQEIGIFRGSHIGNLEDFYSVLNSGEMLYKRSFSYDIDNPKQEIQHHLTKLSGYKIFGDFGKISADYSFQYNRRKEFDLRRGELNEIPALNLELFTNQLNVSHLIERPKWNLESGIDLGYQYNYSTTETQAKRLVPNYSKYNGGFFSVFKYKIQPKFWLEAAVRYDRNHFDVKMWYDQSEWETNYAAEFPEYYVSTDPETSRVFTNPKMNFDNFAFSLGADWSVSDHFSAKFNYAKVSRTPNIAELFSNGLHHSAAVVEQGDLRLKNEEGHQFNLNLSAKADVLNGLEISVNPYAFLTKNFINQVPTGIQNTIRGIFPVWTYQQVNAEMIGLDADVNLNFTKNFSYIGTFAYVYGQDKTHNQPLILMVPTNFSNALEFKNENWRNFYLNVNQQTFFKQKRFPVYNPVISVFENGVEVEKTLDLSTAPKGYSLFNLQAGIDVAKNFSAGLTVSNIFNTKYRDYLNRMRFFSDEMGRNFILHLKYNF